MKIQHERLIKLGQVMRSVKPKNVEMGLILNDLPENTRCGTVGCALGHASLNKTFQQEYGVTPVAMKNGSIGIRYKDRNYSPGSYAEVASKIFGIRFSDADYIFAPACGNGEDQKKEFLKRFNEFMEANGLHK